MKYVNVRTFLREYEKILKELKNGEKLCVTRYGVPLFIVVLP